MEIHSVEYPHFVKRPPTSAAHEMRPGYGVLNLSGGRRLRLPSTWRTHSACSVHTRVNAICFTAPQARFRQIEPAPPKRLRTPAYGADSAGRHDMPEAAGGLRPRGPPRKELESQARPPTPVAVQTGATLTKRAPDGSSRAAIGPIYLSDLEGTYEVAPDAGAGCNRLRRDSSV
jgi:hypothetical protein